MNIMLYTVFLIWLLQQSYNVHSIIIVCFLHKETMVQKVKWIAQAHTINSELTLNQWVIVLMSQKVWTLKILKGIAKLSYKTL